MTTPEDPNRKLNIDKAAVCTGSDTLLDVLETLAPFAPGSWAWYATALKVMRAIQGRVCDDQRFANLELTTEEEEFVQRAAEQLS
jgi:hypothetical protein